MITFRVDLRTNGLSPIDQSYDVLLEYNPVSEDYRVAELYEGDFRENILGRTLSRDHIRMLQRSLGVCQFFTGRSRIGDPYQLVGPYDCKHCFGAGLSSLHAVKSKFNTSSKCPHCVGTGMRSMNPLKAVESPPTELEQYLHSLR